MKRTTFVWALLCLILGPQLSYSATEHQPVKEATTISKKPLKESAKQELALIPGASVSLAIETGKQKIIISSEGLDHTPKVWTIFQPKGDVVSKVTTSAIIDEIDIKNVETGTYILMIKDSEGRALFRSFVIS